MRKRIIVGVSGASGVVMSKILVETLREEGVETFLVVSDSAKLTWSMETDLPIEDLFSLANHVYDEKDFSAPIASGSYVTDGIIVIPCSMKTLAGIACGYADNLLLRSVDVCLKEDRKVVLVPRETPLGKVHLKNLCAASEYGCMIVPPMLTFYHGADTIEAQITHTVGKALQPFGIVPDGYFPWTGGKQ